MAYEKAFEATEFLEPGKSEIRTTLLRRGKRARCSKAQRLFLLRLRKLSQSLLTRKSGLLNPQHSEQLSEEACNLLCPSNRATSECAPHLPHPCKPRQILTVAPEDV